MILRVPHIMLYDDSTKNSRYGITYSGGLIKHFVATVASSLGHSFGTLSNLGTYSEHVRMTKEGPTDFYSDIKINPGNLKVTGSVGVGVNPTIYSLDVRGTTRISPGTEGSGYLGVGGVPLYKLHVFGDSYVTANSTTSKTGIFISQKASAGKDGYIYVNSNDDLVIRKSDQIDATNQQPQGILLDSAGNVGIKHSSPAYDLDLSGALGARFQHSATSNNSKVQIATNGPDVRLYDSDGSAVIKINGNGDTYFKSNHPSRGVGHGYFGIQQNSPSYQLDVAGTGRFTSALVVPSSAPSAATDTCTAGMITWDATYVYVCTATDTWKRAAIATW